MFFFPLSPLMLFFMYYKLRNVSSSKQLCWGLMERKLLSRGNSTSIIQGIDSKQFDNLRNSIFDFLHKYYIQRWTPVIQFHNHPDTSVLHEDH